MDTRFSKTENRNLNKKRYANEFKKEAVRYLVIEGESVASVSKRLGVSPNQLYKWKSLYLSECSADSKTKPDFKEVVADNERLRKELWPGTARTAS
ncbi:MAG: transposase [Candidatus Pelagisphaera sp.]